MTITDTLNGGVQVCATALLVAILPTITVAQDVANEGDIDCAVILCLAAGFGPSECRPALNYMLDRISPPRPKPPFGFCPMSNGEEYTAFDAPYARLNRYHPSGWDCGDGKSLFFKRHEEDDGPDRIETFCYTETTITTYRDDGQSRTRTDYLDQSSATPVNFEIQITVEPNTDGEFVSPRYKMNYRTGYFRAVSGGTAVAAPE